MIRSFAQPEEQSPKRTFIYTRASTTPCLLLVLAVIRRHLSPLTAVRNNQNHFSLISECLCGNRWLKWRPGKCANAWHHTLYRSATVAQDRIGSPVKGANGSWRLSLPAAVLLPTTASSASRIPQGANCADHGRSLGHRNTINIRARSVSPFFNLCSRVIVFIALSSLASMLAPYVAFLSFFLMAQERKPMRNCPTCARTNIRISWRRRRETKRTPKNIDDIDSIEPSLGCYFFVSSTQ